MKVSEKIWTYEELIKNFSPETRVELINNQIFMSPSPNPNHQRISRELEFILYQFVKGRALGEVFDAPFDVILPNEQVVQPDILFIKKENLSKITRRGLEGVPDMVVEVISPSSYYRDTQIKYKLYEQVGVKEFWLVDPSNKVIEVFTLENKVYELYSLGYLEEGSKETEVKSRLLEGLVIKLQDVFESLI